MPFDYENNSMLPYPKGCKKPTRADLYEDDKPAQVQGFTVVARRTRDSASGDIVDAATADQIDASADNPGDMGMPLSSPWSNW